MTTTFTWESLLQPPQNLTTDFRLFLLFVLPTLGFLLYWFTIESPVLKAWADKKWGYQQGSLVFFMFNKTWGFAIFGLGCTWAALLLFPEFSLQTLGLGFSNLPGQDLRPTLAWIGILVPLSLVLSYFQSRKILNTTRDFGRYPEIRVQNWSWKTLTIHVLFWSLYLTGYEILFRGTLLVIPAAYLGPWVAVGINTAFYSAVHIAKGQQEAVGAVVLGLILCLISLTTGNVWTAVIVHIALATSNGYFAYRGRISIHAKNS